MALSLVAAVLMSPPTLAIIPRPVSIRLSDGEFRLNRETAIVADASLAGVAHLLQGALTPATGFDFPLTKRAGTNTIALILDHRVAGDEAYTLDVDRDRIVIRGSKPAGIFYGIQTLRQMLPAEIFRRAKVDRDWDVPCAVIQDQPRFAWRGAHMDVSRHFMPKEFVLKFLDLMALHKLNTFHWHLVDDNGWRIQIKRYPKLTEVGSLTDFSAMNPSQATASPSREPGGFFTQEDIKEVVRYAADRFITVVPEIEMPGHSNAAILAYPELGNKQEILAAGKDVAFMGTYDNVLNVDDSTIAFMKGVLDEVLALFPSKFIHIGGDEVWKEPWHQNPTVQARMKALGLTNEEELQSWFIKQFDDTLTAKGRRLIGWDEILEGGLAPGAAVMSWRGIDGGIAAAKAGHDVVMAPGDWTYLDHYQSKVQSWEPKAIGGYLPLRKVYDFEPIPASLSEEEGKHILGAQGQLWTEFIPNPKHMEYMAYPRLCALAEDVWSPKGSKDWDDFLVRLQPELDRLSVLDVNYRPLTHDPTPAGQWKSGETTQKYAVKEWDVTPSIRPGDLSVLFSYTGGEDRLDIEWIELREDGKVIQRVEQAGQTGAVNRDNVYRIHVDGKKAGAKYTLRASIRSDGGEDSNGDIYILPKRRAG